MSVQIRVVNKHQLNEAERAEAMYVGRGSALGNPFKVKPWGPYERGQTIGLYEEWLRGRVAEGDLQVVRALQDVAVRARRREGVRLMCFCAPKACHAGVIRQVVLDLFGNR